MNNDRRQPGGIPHPDRRSLLKAGQWFSFPTAAKVIVMLVHIGPSSEFDSTVGNTAQAIFIPGPGHRLGWLISIASIRRFPNRRSQLFVIS